MEYAIIWLVCGFVCASVASHKGRDGCGWFCLGVLFGPLALLMSFVLPANKAQLEREAINSKVLKKCPDCAETIKCEAIKCKHCGHTFDPVSAEAENLESMTIQDLYAAAIEDYGNKDYENFAKLRTVISTKYPNSREHKMILQYPNKT